MFGQILVWRWLIRLWLICLVINLFHMRLRDKMPNQLQTGYPEHLN